MNAQLLRYPRGLEHGDTRHHPPFFQQKTAQLFKKGVTHVTAFLISEV